MFCYGGGETFSQNVLLGTTITSFPEDEVQLVAEKIQTFDLFQFPVSDLNILLKAAGENSTDVKFQIGNIYDWSMTIEENDIRSPGFQIVEMTNNGPIYHPKSNVVNTYKGYINGDESQWVRLYVSEHKIGMSFLANGVLYRVAPLSSYLPGHQYDSSYMLFKQSDEVLSEGYCATEMEQSIETSTATPDTPSNVTKVRYLELATDIDYEFYDKYKDVGTGSAISNVNARIDEILNEVDRRYAAEPIFLSVLHIESHIWTTNFDPYSSSNDIVEKWDEFRDEWKDNYNCTARDAAVLFSVGNLAH